MIRSDRRIGSDVSRLLFDKLRTRILEANHRWISRDQKARRSGRKAPGVAGSGERGEGQFASTSINVFAGNPADRRGRANAPKKGAREEDKDYPADWRLQFAEWTREDGGPKRATNGRAGLKEEAEEDEDEAEEEEEEEEEEKEDARQKGPNRPAERQRQNATNSKRAESCACIRNAIGPLSTGAGPPFVSRGLLRRSRRTGCGGWVEALPPVPAAGKF
ncbi:hypothetical protein KM043_008725 [Ampulex compressa]|nr:hypothetical protein KM043_008725 [Ampulex compressa]